MKARILVFILIIITNSCKKEKVDNLFTLIDPNQSGIHFANQLPYDEEFNTYTYRNFYNGGGVALGDINNDGLLDVFFTGNIVGNKLYINKGNFKFEDITDKAGVSCIGVWSTGATFVDINGDNLLDIYVCKAGKPGGVNRHNELFINLGNLKFEEKSKDYGLDITGLSIHSAFFDYDKDGDLDCYILNNSLRSIGGFDLKENQRNVPDSEGNKFLKNENGKFIDIAKEAGIYTSSIGYGLGITLSDFNQDNWTDIFISNDFFERDYLYINNKNGKFIEVGDKSFLSMSMGSMGADAADMDNDLLSDLFVTEMLPSTLERKKTKNIYETWDKYSASVEKGYYHQYSRNVLQRNIGNGKFLEIARKAGIAATDWSWAALIQDFDNDGLKDLFVSNGQYKDLLDRDYLNYSGDAAKIRNQINNKQKVLMPLIDSMPSQPLKNFMYKNEGNFHFKDVTDQWGFGNPTFSNGSAYGDLDNDGDLDLVINNANMPAYVYKNNTDSISKKSIQFKLIGQDKNLNALGAKIIMKHKNGQSMIENFSARGFESSTVDKLTLGVGDVSIIDTAIIIWPNDKQTILTNLKSNNLYTLKQSEAKSFYLNLEKVDKNENKQVELIDFVHQEHKLNLFSKERMLVEMPGFDGPAIAVGDVNNDKIDDVFCGGGRDQVSTLYLSNGSSYQKIIEPFLVDQKAEKVCAKFFDSDNDGDLDLYVAHGGKLFSIYSQELHDVLYINSGKGNLEKSVNFTEFPKPISTGDVAIEDVNNDGKKDIVIGEKLNQDLFGAKGNVYILYNQGNNRYKCESPKVLQNLGMISALSFFDKNKDGYKDLLITGKWMPILIAQNTNGTFLNIDQHPSSTGLWNTIEKADIDHDGDEDFIVGNEGLNNFYQIGHQLLINDFDENGSSEQIICEKSNDDYYPIHDNDEMFSQMPSMKKKYLKHHDFSKAGIKKLFKGDQIKSSITSSIEELRSGVLINESGKFRFESLPSEIQYSSVYAIYYHMATGKLYFGGNQYKVKPQFGRQDASLGWILDSRDPSNWPSKKVKILYV
ncbi:MAG: hypothetical protein RLZZ546_2424, partial [Bacteroidota bacterium]